MDKRTLFAITAIVTGSVGMSPRLFAQALSVGVIGGGSLTSAVQDVTTRYRNSPFRSRVLSRSRDWMAVALLELRFRSPFSVEVDGMYRELHMTWASVMPDGTLNSVSPSPVITWEFPVLAKYRFNWGNVK